MALILSIDTAMENAGICIANGKDVIATKKNSKQMDHAGWVHTAVKEILEETGKEMAELEAVAVTAGPGSYTGLRVGMATAKGFCYALDIPLITESTLKLIAVAVKENIKSAYSYPILFCPMIDARRLEVFTTLYDNQWREIMPPTALVLDSGSFQEQMTDYTIVFAGNGSVKWQNICNHSNAVFSGVQYDIENLALIAAEKYEKEQFSGLAYTEPAYLKNVYTGLR